MSHFRKLFHKTSEFGAVPSAAPAPTVAAAASVAAVPDHVAKSFKVATPADPPPADPPTAVEFPIEEACLTPEARLICHDEPSSPAADRFRLLRMHLRAQRRAKGLGKLLITGPLHQDGKSTVVLNLASTVAERGKRNVLVVEADMHNPCLAGSLGLRPWAGLAQCLVDHTTQPFSAIRRIEPMGWYLLPAGESRKNPTELLQTPMFAHILQTLAPYFDWILIDSPPVIPLTDSLSLQQHTDGTLLVVRAGQTPREAVEHAVALLGKKNILGIILNGLETRGPGYYQQYRYGRKDQEDPSRGASAGG
jgi:capsular exopolysaccharide synthesis family protein